MVGNATVDGRDDSGEGERDYVEIDQHVESPHAEEQAVLSVAYARPSFSKENQVPAQAETKIPAPEKPVQENLPPRTQEVEVKDPSEAIRIECDSPCTRPRDPAPISPSPNPNPRQHTTAQTEPTSPHSSPPHTLPETNSIEPGTPHTLSLHTPPQPPDLSTQETILSTTENTELLDHQAEPQTLTTSSYQSKFYPQPSAPRNPIQLHSEDISLDHNTNPNFGVKKISSPKYVKPPIICGTDTKLMPMGGTEGDFSVSDVGKNYSIEDNSGNFEHGGVGGKGGEFGFGGKQERV